MSISVITALQLWRNLFRYESAPISTTLKPTSGRIIPMGKFRCKTCNLRFHQNQEINCKILHCPLMQKRKSSQSSNVNLSVLSFVDLTKTIYENPDIKFVEEWETDKEEKSEKNDFEWPVM